MLLSYFQNLAAPESLNFAVFQRIHSEYICIAQDNFFDVAETKPQNENEGLFSLMFCGFFFFF